MKALKNKIYNRLYQFLVLIAQKPRIKCYQILSSAKPIKNKAKYCQPVLFLGKGEISIDHCTLGIWLSPHFFTGYIHIEARNSTAKISIAKNVWINNNTVIIAEQNHIIIGEHTLIGTECTIYDSDFHDLSPLRRLTNKIENTAPVNIGNNVFIGSRVTILKGVSIGDNSVIATGSIVSKDIPENVIAAGIPAKVIRTIT